jgi:ABC-type bacteriocin/lantibiotic exporter with double-glycine peptidase domain
LILDEPTSALDGDNEAAIAAALQRLRGRLTVLLIAHRGALADVADRTVTIAAGQITGVRERD